MKSPVQARRAARPAPRPITFLVLRHRERWPRGLGAALLALMLTVAVYLTVVRPWHQTWGATSAEVARYIAGDSLVADPQEITTRAITIHAEPRDIWPWLAQMGRGRGGLYSYDILSRVRARLPWHFGTPFMLAALDPAEFLMMRRQLLGIRERAERLAALHAGPASRAP